MSAIFDDDIGEHAVGERPDGTQAGPFVMVLDSVRNRVARVSHRHRVNMIPGGL